MSDTSIGPATGGRRGAARGGALPAPSIVLAGTVALLLAALALPLTLPIGPLYWDLFIYFDAANRIFDGQLPGVDFFAPVGPLGYWLFAGGLKLFPQAQPLLLVQWSFLAVTGPLVGLVVAEADRRSRWVALALLLPFLVFAILPINVEDYASLPGVDGYGIYNRQGSQLLYVLAAALLFMRRGPRMGIVVAGAMLALFLTKVTGFVAGGLLCAYALAAGRVRLRMALAVAAGFAAVLLGLDGATHVVRAYVGDIVALVGMNEGVLASRFLQAASIQFLAFGPAALLILSLLVLSRRDMAGDVRALLARPRPAALAHLLDRDVLWLGTAVFAALFFETQNTGGQAFLCIWPALLLVVLRSERFDGAALALVLCLVAASAFPTLAKVVARASRALVGQVQYQRLDLPNLKTLGSVSQRPELMRHAAVMREAYARYKDGYAFIADAGELPGYTLYSEPSYQLLWLTTLDEAVSAVRAYEAANGVRIETIMTLAFTNPFPWLLDRHATRLVAIGADPTRAVPDPDAAVMAAVAATDLALYPTCPPTAANKALSDLYAPALAQHARVTLSPCWDAFVRRGLPPS